MSNSKITLGLLALGLALSSAAMPALAESAASKDQLFVAGVKKQRLAAVAKPAVAGFVVRSNSGYTRDLAKLEIYADSLRSK